MQPHKKKRKIFVCKNGPTIIFGGPQRSKMRGVRSRAECRFGRFDRARDVRLRVGDRKKRGLEL